MVVAIVGSHETERDARLLSFAVVVYCRSHALPSRTLFFLILLLCVCVLLEKKKQQKAAGKVAFIWLLAGQSQTTDNRKAALLPFIVYCIRLRPFLSFDKPFVATLSTTTHSLYYFFI